MSSRAKIHEASVVAVRADSVVALGYVRTFKVHSRIHVRKSTAHKFIIVDDGVHTEEC